MFIWETNTELVPKSIIFEIETSRVVKRAYLPKVMRSKDLAITARNTKPIKALKAFPAPTVAIFLNDFNFTLIY